MLLMARPAVVPFRWVSHGLDIRVAGTAERPLLSALDICRALGLQVTLGDKDWVTGMAPRLYDFDTEQLDGALERDGQPAAFVDVDGVRAIADELPMVLQSEFMEWLEQLLDMPAPELAGVLGAALPTEPGRTEPVKYDVAAAARILSCDPALSYGQHALFEAMQAIGWISRDGDIWVPSTAALQAGHLVRRDRWISGLKVSYPQIRITAPGLTALHERLGGVARLSTDTPPAPSLLEL